MAQIKRADLSDSRVSLRDVKFAPKHMGLKLATCTDDGMVRIYEAMDVMNLASWSQTESFKVRSKSKCTCISWNPSRLGDPWSAFEAGSRDRKEKGRTKEDDGQLVGVREKGRRQRRSRQVDILTLFYFLLALGT